MALLYEKEDKTVIITFNRPEAMNSFDPDQTREFSEALIKFRDDPDAWVAIITAVGEKAFSAGFDLKNLASQDEGKADAPPIITRGLKIYKPIIAAVNGVALGAGFETVLACDLRIAAENARFGLPEVKWSLIPGWGGTQRLPRAIHKAKAAEMILMGVNIDAKEAYEIGLINLVVPSSELISTAKEWARKICENGPLAVKAAKESMCEGTEKPLDEALEIELTLINNLLLTEDAKEGPLSFMEKRKPVFKGK